MYSMHQKQSPTASQALEYTEDSRQAGGRRHRLVSVNEDKNKLIDLFKKPGATVGEVQDWIHVSLCVC